MDECNLLAFTKPRGSVLIGNTIDQNTPCVGLMNAAKHLDQGGFACAILSQQRNNLAAPNRERDIFQRIRTAKVLFDAVKEQT